jgi:hypothetical protein
MSLLMSKLFILIDYIHLNNKKTLVLLLLRDNSIILGKINQVRINNINFSFSNLIKIFFEADVSYSVTRTGA